MRMIDEMLKTKPWFQWEFFHFQLHPSVVLLHCGFTILQPCTKPSNVLHSSDSMILLEKKTQKTNTQTAGSDHRHRSSRNDRSRNEKWGTRNGIWDRFLHYGNKNVPVSVPGMTWTWNKRSRWLRFGLHRCSGFVRSRRWTHLSLISSGYADVPILTSSRWDAHAPIKSWHA